jgi:cytochrome c-type biogenesis protein CcmF
MGVGPLIAWRRSSFDSLAKTFAAPALFGITTGGCAFIAGLREWYVLTALSLAAFVIGTIVVEFRRGVSARRHMVAESVPAAMVNLIAKNNRRYGGYVIHLGVVLAFTGIVASAFFKTEVKKSVKQGDTFQVGAYDLEYLGLETSETPHRRDRSRACGSSAQRQADRDDGAREALLQAPPATCDRGRDSIDARRRPLRRAGRYRR